MNPLLFQPAEFLPSVEIPAAEIQAVAKCFLLFRTILFLHLADNFCFSAETCGTRALLDYFYLPILLKLHINEFEVLMLV